jgi:hypothetical protein
VSAASSSAFEVAQRADRRIVAIQVQEGTPVRRAVSSVVPHASLKLRELVLRPLKSTTSRR